MICLCFLLVFLPCLSLSSLYFSFSTLFPSPPFSVSSISSLHSYWSFSISSASLLAFLLFILPSLPLFPLAFPSLLSYFLNFFSYLPLAFMLLSFLHLSSSLPIPVFIFKNFFILLFLSTFFHLSFFPPPFLPSILSPTCFNHS